MSKTPDEMTTTVTMVYDHLDVEISTDKYMLPENMPKVNMAQGDEPEHLETYAQPEAFSTFTFKRSDGAILRIAPNTEEYGEVWQGRDGKPYGPLRIDVINTHEEFERKTTPRHE